MFRHPSVRYGTTPEPVTPYQKAAQVWDERIGSARIQAKSWRYAFFGALGLSAALTGGLIWQNARGWSLRKPVCSLTPIPASWTRPRSPPSAKSVFPRG